MWYNFSVSNGLWLFVACGRIWILWKCQTCLVWSGWGPVTGRSVIDLFLWCPDICLNIQWSQPHNCLGIFGFSHVPGVDTISGWLGVLRTLPPWMLLILPSYLAVSCLYPCESLKIGKRLTRRALGVLGSCLSQTWAHISIPLLEYLELSEKVLIMFYGRLIICKEYRDLEALVQLGLVASFHAS